MKCRGWLASKDRPGWSCDRCRWKLQGSLQLISRILPILRATLYSKPVPGPKAGEDKSTQHQVLSHAASTSATGSLGLVNFRPLSTLSASTESKMLRNKRTIAAVNTCMNQQLHVALSVVAMVDHWWYPSIPFKGRTRGTQSGVRGGRGNGRWPGQHCAGAAPSQRFDRFQAYAATGWQGRTAIVIVAFRVLLIFCQCLGWAFLASLGRYESPLQGYQHHYKQLTTVLTYVFTAPWLFRGF